MKNKKIFYINLFLILLSFTFNLLNKTFYEISKVPHYKRVPKSRIVQFCYTSELNMGDYIPTLGIWKMLGQKTDLWSIKDKNIDFNFINKHYKCAIIGGAGILSKKSQFFYEQIISRCKIPVIIWGTGMCLPYGKVNIQTGINLKVMKSLEKKCDLINVRDMLTKQHYNLNKAQVAPCPCVAYLQSFKDKVISNSSKVTYVSHDQLVPVNDNNKIKNILRTKFKNLSVINNIFKTNKSIEEIDNIITKHYCKSKLIITTRLHGAIMAYALGIPYIAIAFDQKLISFHKTYGNGILAKSVNDLPKVLNSNLNFKLDPIKLDDVFSFGYKAKSWVLKNLKRKS